MLVEVVGRAGCLSLLFMKSLSIASHFAVSSAVVSQVMSLVRSLLSLLVLSGCKKLFEVVLPSLGWSSLFAVTFLLG